MTALTTDCPLSTLLIAHLEQLLALDSHDLFLILPTLALARKTAREALKRPGSKVTPKVLDHLNLAALLIEEGDAAQRPLEAALSLLKGQQQAS